MPSYRSLPSALAVELLGHWTRVALDAARAWDEQAAASERSRCYANAGYYRRRGDQARSSALSYANRLGWMR